MVSIGLFTNIKSGQNEIDREKYGQARRIRRLRAIVKDGNKGRVYITGVSKDYIRDLERMASAAHNDKPDVIAIDGGDGTVSTVLTALDKQWKSIEMPPIAIMPGGTFNVLARRMEIKNSYSYLENIAKTDSADNLTVKDINMMRVVDNMGYDHLSFSVGVGLPVALLEEVYKKKHLKYLRIGLMTARILLSAFVEGAYYKRFNKHSKLKLMAKGNADKICDDEKGQWLGIIAQTIETLGIPKFLPQPKIFRKAETEGRFHAVGTKLSFSKLLQYLPAIYTGDSVYYSTPGQDEKTPVLALDKQLKDLVIQSDEPFKYQFNGELYFGPNPCITNELFIFADRNVKFIADDF